MKKIVSVLLAVLIMFSSISIGVFAADITAETRSSDNSSSSFLAGILQFFSKIRAFLNLLFGIKEEVSIPEIQISSSIETSSDNCIEIVSVSGSYYLFLSSGMNKSDLIFKFPDSDNVKVDGETVEAGKPTDILADKDSFILKINGKSYFVEILQSANIPALYITTESGNMDAVHANKDNKEYGNLVFINADGSIEYDNTIEYIKGRGNSSWKYPKKGYNLKLDKSTNLNGLGKTKKWSLIPNYIDKSLLRNQIVYDLADSIGLDFSPANTPVDLYLNGVYNGTYLLVVKNEIDSAAIDITNLEKATEKVNEQDLDLYKNIAVSNENGLVHYKYNDIPNNPDDITGGYLLELDHSSYSKEASGFTTAKGQRIVIKAPEYASKAQVEYIGKWFQEFEDAVYSVDGYNSLGKHYTEYIDNESFAKYYTLSEVAMNGDSHITSVFMYKESDIDGDGLLHAGPVWDYDSSLGNNGGVKGFDVNVTLTNPAQQFYSISKIYKGNGVDYIYCALYKHNDFRNLVIDVYKNDMIPALDLLLSKNNDSESGLKSFDKYAECITYSAEMNFKRWPIMANATTGTQTGTTYKANLDNLYNFIKNKKAFLDKIIDAYSEDYLYIFVDGVNIYGVKSFADNTVELYSGNAKLNSTIKHGEKSFKVTSVR